MTTDPNDLTQLGRRQRTLEQGSALEGDETRLARRDDIQDRTRLSRRADDTDDRTRLAHREHPSEQRPPGQHPSERLSEAGAHEAFNMPAPSEPFEPFAPEQQGGFAEELWVEEPRQRLTSTVPISIGGRQPSLGDLELKTLVGQQNRYKRVTRGLMWGFTAFMAALGAGAVVGIWMIAASF